MAAVSFELFIRLKILVLKFIKLKLISLIFVGVISEVVWATLFLILFVFVEGYKEKSFLKR